ncbi:MAG: ketosteroid isomerase [Balneola sp.]|jgi:ketosteroid isomerase-like protein|nr:ketosteroid isomerase [Balneola sp.]MBE78559.1 ketosteroid isomerase [Balneola sp.]HBX64873.1 ketosteroid isomerase [Balneolaceae bacterium]|tara:strand:- start:856 stop:1317 length:462 start_codon:yes stop_codon:yes gene_type:complete
MDSNKQLIHKLYLALKEQDAKTMLSCYHEKATFKDPVFELHSKSEIDDMWTMLCSRAKEFELTFDEVEADDSTGSAHVEAKYLFSATGRKVHNKIDANFQFQDGLIIEHRDYFDFWRWSRYALGLPGYLLGWTPFLQKKVQKEVRNSMEKFRG